MKVIYIKDEPIQIVTVVNLDDKKQEDDGGILTIILIFAIVILICGTIDHFTIYADDGIPEYEKGCMGG